jgi:hypothetical protein
MPKVATPAVSAKKSDGHPEQISQALADPRLVAERRDLEAAAIAVTTTTAIAIIAAEHKRSPATRPVLRSRAQ